ncbi:MAG: hypothetical protein K2N73_08170 [Lachnospiraceae bacterium]|nr:hypothetical protein [Lachnospiraceae bacterium]
MFWIKNHFIKNMLAALGVVLWVGALSPEILVKPGIGCILDADGKELTMEDAEDFMEAYFYGTADSDEETKVEIKYRFALLELLE